MCLNRQTTCPPAYTPFHQPVQHIPRGDTVLAHASPCRKLRLLIAARKRFAEDALATAVARRGVRQLVALGAGLDTYPYRPCRLKCDRLKSSIVGSQANPLDTHSFNQANQSRS